MKQLSTTLILLLCSIAQAQIIHRVAGTVGVGGYAGVGGPANAAVIQNPQSVALDTFGNLFIADGDNNVIQKVDAAGIITTIAGNGGRGYSGDGGPATDATLNSPTGLSIDMAGSIYFADNGNNIVRVINSAGIIKTVAGNYMAGYAGDGGPATSAKLNWPFGTAIDHNGNLYITDQNNDVIRKVNNTGVISTFAGNGIRGYAGDGESATNAELSAPYGIAVDDTGSLLIADSRNNVIRKVDTFGIITTIAGDGSAGYSGNSEPATAAQLNLPVSLGINKLGIYIADLYNNVIRKVDTLGIISTVAGSNINGYSGDGGLASYAQINYPLGIAVDRYGDFYFGDVFNFVVRKVDTSHAKEGLNTISGSNRIFLFPNPVVNELNINSPKGISSVVITDLFGVIAINQVAIFPTQNLSVNVKDFPNGIYLIRINNIFTTKFLKQ